MDPFLPNQQKARETRQEDVLQEKDFIEESRSPRNNLVWWGILIISGVLVSIFVTYNWYLGYINQEKANEPFLNISNRQFSIFLWQFPSFLRKNSSIKTGYLPGFEISEEAIRADAIEEDVSAPPDLLFLYQTWNRLLAIYYISRPISPDLFEEFLNQSQEWLPQFWKSAPPSYKQLINSHLYKEIPDLQTLNEEELPIIVRQAFQGWKNYFREGAEINALEPTFGEIQLFLEKYPHYARNYWRNIYTAAQQPVAGQNYLLDFFKTDRQIEEFIPQEHLSTFLKVGLFNARQSNLGN